MKKLTIKQVKKIIGKNEEPVNVSLKDWVNARNNLRHEQRLALEELEDIKGEK